MNRAWVWANQNTSRLNVSFGEWEKKTFPFRFAFAISETIKVGMLMFQKLGNAHTMDILKRKVVREELGLI
jgi:hypothetical protein